MITLGNLSGFRTRVQDPCLGKRVFMTFAEAQVEIDRIVRRGHQRSHQGVLKPYSCPKCGRVHMGHARPFQP